MLVHAVMHAPPVTIDPSATVQEAARRMRTSKVGAVLAVHDRAPVGILTESDLTRLVAEGHDAGKVRVRDVMSHPVVTVAATTHLEAAARIMKERRLKRLVVVVGSEVRGVLTARDLAYSMPESMHRYASALKQRWID